MAGAVRYRSGIDETTGRPLVGVPHLVQSLAKIWRTPRNSVGSRSMLLSFGNDLRSVLAEDLTPEIALLIYNELVASAARWEPEYLLTQLQLVRMTEGGALGLKHGGIYYPEGRFGNYALAIDLSLNGSTAQRLA